jgi:predicted transcriptional regulator/plasmid maintenance system antidote protein VapI
MPERNALHILTGTRIRERRLSMSRRQAEVARSVGISPAYLNLIEHNRRPVTAELLVKLARELQVPPDELSEGREEARIAALREAAAHPGSEGATPELDQVAEFLARFPGWSSLLLAQARRASGLERQLVDLSDRMTHDPYLLMTLHEVLSAVTSLRSTASILVEEQEIPQDWRQRFHANLAEDSLRLSVTAQELVRYVDSFETEGTPLTPQEEVENWLDAGAAPPETATELASDSARALAARISREILADRIELPDARLTAVLASGVMRDPLLLAGDMGLPLDLIMRRLAMLRPPGYEGAGLVICDGSGALTLRRAAPGFPLPRPGDTCPLWPLYLALAMPQTAIARHVVTPEGRAFRSLSFATRSQPLGLDGPVLLRGHMMLLPAEGAAPPHALQVGPACRICPRSDCPARREPSILAPRAGQGASAAPLPNLRAARRAKDMGETAG